jgi:hypothetical protein
LDELAKSVRDDVETLVLRGYLAADRGALADADRYLTLAANLEPPHADWPWEIACARAELYEQRAGMLGDLLAEYWRATRGRLRADELATPISTFEVPLPHGHVAAMSAPASTGPSP